MGEKSYYYRWQLADPATGDLALDEDGSPIVERIGPLPSDGDWPSRYGLRGLHLQPPGEISEDAWRGLWTDVLEEGFTLDDARRFIEDALTLDETELPKDDGSQAPDPVPVEPPAEEKAVRSSK